MGEQMENQLESVSADKRPVNGLPVDGATHETNEVIVLKRRNQNGSGVRTEMAIKQLEEIRPQLGQESDGQFRFMNPGERSKVVSVWWLRKPVDAHVLKKGLTHTAARSPNVPPESISLAADILTRRPLAGTFKSPRYMAGGTFTRRSGTDAGR